MPLLPVLVAKVISFLYFSCNILFVINNKCFHVVLPSVLQTHLLHVLFHLPGCRRRIQMQLFHLSILDKLLVSFREMDFQNSTDKLNDTLHLQQQNHLFQAVNFQYFETIVTCLWKFQEHLCKFLYSVC